MFKFFKNKKGLTLVEVLMVVMAISILFIIIFWALDPVRKLANTRNTQRIMDMDTILKAVYQYSIDHDGSFPFSISKDEKEICQTGFSSCEGGIDLSVLTDERIYLYKIPVDPKVKALDRTGYAIRKEYDRIIIRALHSENGESIEVEK
jgi:prepilin-type N-terminal cleavage/methylation domain-containing protein